MSERAVSAPVEASEADRLVETARSLRPRLATLAGRDDRSAAYPAESIAMLHEAGLLTATVGRDHGGPGLGHHGVHRLLLELGQADPSAALIATMTLAVHQREATAPALPVEVYAAVLRESWERPTLLNSLQVEPALGTPSRGGVPATVARRTPDGWRLSGHKIFSTGAPGLRFMLVLAATDEPEPRVGSFVVDASSPGVTVVPSWAATGMRASRSDDVLFENVLVPREWSMGLVPAGEGHENATGPGTAIPSIYLGVAHAARDWLISFLRERVPANLGHPLIELPRFADELGEMELRLTAATDLVAALARDADDAREVARASAWAAKITAQRVSTWVVQRAVSLIGNPGLSTDNPLERHLRDVLCAGVHFPQEDTVLRMLGGTAIRTPITTTKGAP